MRHLSIFDNNGRRSQQWFVVVVWTCLLRSLQMLAWAVDRCVSDVRTQRRRRARQRGARNGFEMAVKSVEIYAGLCVNNSACVHAHTLRTTHIALVRCLSIINENLSDGLELLYGGYDGAVCQGARGPSRQPHGCEQASAAALKLKTMR